MPLTLADLARLQGLHQRYTTAFQTLCSEVATPEREKAVKIEGVMLRLQLEKDAPDLLALAALGLQVQQIRARIEHDLVISEIVSRNMGRDGWSSASLLRDIISLIQSSQESRLLLDAAEKETKT